MAAHRKSLYGKLKFIARFLLILLTPLWGGCEVKAPEEGEINSNEVADADSPQARQQEDPVIVKHIKDLEVPATFNWKLANDVNIHLDLINSNGELVRKTPISIYVDRGIDESYWADTGTLIFKGYSDSQGRISIKHRFVAAEARFTVIGGRGAYSSMAQISLDATQMQDEDIHWRVSL